MINKFAHRPVVFIDTPMSKVALSDIQQLLSARKRKVQETVLLNGPLSQLPIKYPPSLSYKQYILRLISLLKKDGISTKYFNTSINTREEIFSLVETPLCFVFSDTTPQLNEIWEYSNQLKLEFPDSNIICGGPHSTINPKIHLEKGIDIVVCGNGDIAFPELILALVNNSHLSTLKISGVYTKYTQIENTLQYAENISHMDKLPLPDYDSLPGGLSKFHAYLMSSRGCQFSCPFCFHGASSHTSHYFSPSRIWIEINEIWERVKNEYNFIHFADDNIVTRDGSNLESLLNERNVKIDAFFCGEIRLDACIKKNLNLLRNLRFVQLNIGIESLDERVQMQIGKSLSFETIIERLNMIKEIFDGNIITKAYIMVGLPGETIDTINLTSHRILTLLNKKLLDLVSIRMYKPLPGTDIFENQRHYNLSVTFDNYREFERYSFPPVHSLKNLSQVEIYLLYLLLEARVTEKQEKMYGIEYKTKYNMNLLKYSEFLGKLV